MENGEIDWNKLRQKLGKAQMKRHYVRSRNVLEIFSIDIRYALFINDKYAGATHFAKRNGILDKK